MKDFSQFDLRLIELGVKVIGVQTHLNYPLLVNASVAPDILEKKRDTVHCIDSLQPVVHSYKRRHFNLLKTPENILFSQQYKLIKFIVNVVFNF